LRNEAARKEGANQGAQQAQRKRNGGANQAGAKQRHCRSKACADAGPKQAQSRRTARAKPARTKGTCKLKGARQAQRGRNAGAKPAQIGHNAGAAQTQSMHKAGTADAKQAQGMRQAGGNQPARHTAANAQPTHNRHRWEIRAKCLCPVPKGPEQKVQNLRNPRNRKMHGRHCQEEQHCSWRPEEGRPERIGGATKKGHKVTQRPPQGLETGTSGCRRRSAGTWSSRTGGE
jgi:hypothetical protein